jgi:hypothetical protein
LVEDRESKPLVNRFLAFFAAAIDSNFRACSDTMRHSRI